MITHMLSLPQGIVLKEVGVELEAAGLRQTYLIWIPLLLLGTD